MTTWTIDTAHTEITFAVRHMMISTVRGRFDKLAGTVEFDEQHPAHSKVNVQIETGSIYTKEAQRDAHLRSADFFDAEHHPYATFKSTRVEPTSATTGRIIGDLTIRGVTKEVVLDAQYAGQARSPYGTVSAGFSAHTKINRKEWGLNWNVALETGGVLVGDEVTLNLELELVKQPEQTPAAVAVN
jgi:polyisoprenoid-binding protein YceI